jgi:hypothetical protein
MKWLPLACSGTSPHLHLLEPHDCNYIEPTDHVLGNELTGSIARFSSIKNLPCQTTEKGTVPP